MFRRAVHFGTILFCFIQSGFEVKTDFCTWIPTKEHVVSLLNMHMIEHEEGGKMCPMRDHHQWSIPFKVSIELQIFKCVWYPWKPFIPNEPWEHWGNDSLSCMVKILLLHRFSESISTGCNLPGENWMWAGEQCNLNASHFIISLLKKSSRKLHAEWLPCNLAMNKM